MTPPSAPSSPPAARDLPAEAPCPAEPEWLIDGFNLLHVGVLRGREREPGWWRHEGRRRVIALAARFPAPAGRVVVVFDGPHPAAHEEEGPRVVFAPSADRWLLARVREAPAPERVTVVTADRSLGSRLRARGAHVMAPAEFLARCRPGPDAESDEAPRADAT